MATYRVKADEVQAFEFTPELGKAAQEGLVKPVGDNSITFESGRGYRFNASPLSFGDFVVLSHGVAQVMSAKEFAGRYEEVPEVVAPVPVKVTSRKAAKE